MQVIIDLHAEEAGVHHSSEEAKRKWEIAFLHELLRKLEAEGYEIHSLYGSFIFDNELRSAIDVGEPGDNVHASVALAQSIYESGGKLAVVFTSEKYVVFANRYFLAIHLCHMQRMRPITLTMALRNLDSLFLHPRYETLKFLYRLQFDVFYGLHAEPVPCIKDDDSPHRGGYAAPGPMLYACQDPDEDEDE